MPAFLFTGFPVAYVLGGVGVLFTVVGYYSDIYLGTLTGLDYMTLGMAVNRVYKYMDNWVLVALPMFIFMGLMLDHSGIAEKMMKAMQNLFGKVRGGLAVTVTMIGIILAASTGIIGAFGGAAGPAVHAGHDGPGLLQKPLALGTIAGSGTLGILIPPSIMLVIMADQLGLSVGDLFMGAVVPGVILGALYITFILVYCFFKPEAAPLSPERKPLEWSMVWGRFQDHPAAGRPDPGGAGLHLRGHHHPHRGQRGGVPWGPLSWPPGTRRLSFKVIKEVTFACFNTTAYIFAIFLGATTFALVLRSLGGDEFIEAALTGIPLGPHGIMAVILGVIFLLGFFLDWIEITLIVLPLLAPVISALGIHVEGHGGGGEPRVGLVRDPGGGELCKPASSRHRWALPCSI